MNALDSTNAGIIRRLADRLIACPIGELVTKVELGEVAGADFDTIRHLFPRARKLACSEIGAVFRTEYRLGYVRMPGGSGGASVMRTGRVSIDRKAATTVFYGSNVMARSNDVTAADRTVIAREINNMGIIRNLTKDRWVQPDENVGRPPPTAASISAMILDQFKEAE